MNITGRAYYLLIYSSKIFALLIKFNGSQHISSANLFACIGALTNIGKHRPVFLDQVIGAIEHVHSNLPPTLSTTQVNSVRKKLKSELMGLIKHPSTFEFVDTITPMLIDLGKINYLKLKRFNFTFLIGRMFSTRYFKEYGKTRRSFEKAIQTCQ